MTSDSIFLLWPITPLGAEDGEDGGQSTDSNDSGQSGDTSNSGGNQQNSSQNNNSGQESDEDDPYKGLTTKELKRLLKDAEGKAEEGDTARKALQDKLDEDERKKRTKEENLTKDVEARDETIATLRKSLAAQSIINAINENKQYEWNSAGIVAQQLDPNKVKVDDSGKVTGLEKELARIAGDENLKFLQVHGDSGKQQQQQQQSNTGSTGFQPGQGGASSNGSGIPENAASLAKLMPALNSRVMDS